MVPSQPSAMRPNGIGISSPLPPASTLIDITDAIKASAPIHRFLDRSSEKVTAHELARTAEVLSGQQTTISSSSSSTSIAINHPNPEGTAAALPNFVAQAPENVAPAIPAHTASSLIDDVRNAESLEAECIQPMIASSVPAANPVRQLDQSLPQTSARESM